MPPAEYDPVKAHAYYERTKHLKGRRLGTAPDPPAQHKASQAQIQSAQQKVAAIQGKLDRLRALLREKTASSSSSKPESKNAAQKAADAKDSKEYYDKHRQEIKNKREKSSSGGGGGAKTAADMDADELRTAIRNTVSQLKTAIANAQRLRGGG